MGAEKFAQEFGTKPVAFTVGGGDGMGDDLVAAIVAGDPWDLQYAFGVVIFPTALAKGVFTPITKYLDVNDPDLSKITLDGAKWKDDYYGISNLGMQEFSYSTYNETWFKEIGVKTPYERFQDGEWTQDGFVKMVEEIKERGADYAMNWHRVNVLGRYMTKWNNDGTCEITYDSPENISWLTRWENFVYNPAYAHVSGNGHTADGCGS